MICGSRWADVSTVSIQDRYSQQNPQLQRNLSKPRTYCMVQRFQRRFRSRCQKNFRTGIMEFDHPKEADVSYDGARRRQLILIEIRLSPTMRTMQLRVKFPSDGLIDFAFVT